MKRTKLIFNISFFVLLGLVLSYQIVNSKPKSETFLKHVTQGNGSFQLDFTELAYLLGLNKTKF